MTTLSQFIESIKNRMPTAEVIFRYPTLFIVCQDEMFSSIPEGEREAVFIEQKGINPEDLATATHASAVQLIFCTASERADMYQFLDAPDAIPHWTGSLANFDKVRPISEPTTRFVHFYGYKGGQARSSVLAVLAQSLASDGYRVLAVDADLEAPSLHTIFNAPAVPPASTLLGCALHQLEPAPQTVVFPNKGNGRVDLLACRPMEGIYDLDAANFALQAALDPSMLRDALGKVSRQSTWDVILVDHRTGLAPSVLPIVAGFPGPIVSCLRLDEQSAHASAYFSALYRQNPSSPGLILSFSLDPKENHSTFVDNNRAKIETALQPLAEALSGDSADPTAPEQIIDFCVPWFHDYAFLKKALPETSDMSKANLESLQAMRNLLDLPILVPSATGPKPAATPPPAAGPDDLSGSGNKDMGTLIQNDVLRRLLPPETPYTYILGRKGTGKTRLLRALADKNLGEPMLVAEDYPHDNGIKCTDTILGELKSVFAANPDHFWWALLDSALESTETDRQHSVLERILEEKKAGPAFSVLAITKRILGMPGKKVFLIDGVETAFTSSHIHAFVAGLFRFLAEIQSDVRLSQKVVVRLFIRTDLVYGARENIEQQIEHRTLQLSWNTQTILNFVLARIAVLPWFRDNFPNAVNEINDRYSDLIQGAVTEEECGRVLREIFPSKVRRHNILILTFLTTWFSDGQGDSVSYYPRVYDLFLRFIAAGGNATTGRKLVQLENDKVAQDIIASAHEEACKNYLHQVRDELKYLIELDEDIEKNGQQIDDLLSQFNGRSTPFPLDDTLAELASSTGLAREKISRALQQMKRVGIFEEHPKSPRQWRAGRLFKSSLGMRYNRKRRDGDDSGVS